MNYRIVVDYLNQHKYSYSLALLVLLSFFLSLAELQSVEDDQRFITFDAREYISLAENMDKGNGYKITEGRSFLSQKETSYRTPGYPLFMLLIKKLFGADKYILATILYQHFLLAFLPVIFYFLTFLLVKRKGYALFSAVLASFFFPFRYLASIIHPDFLSFFLLLIALLLFLYHLEKEHIGKLLAFSVFLALAIMVKQNFVILMLLYLYPLPKLLRKKELILALIFPFLVLSAWVTRNYIVHDKFPVFVTNGGLNFYYANHPDIEINLSNVSEYSLVMRKLMIEGKSETEAERYLYGRGFQLMSSNGFTWQVKRLFRKVMVVFRDYYPQAKNEIFFLMLPFIFLLKRKKYPLIFLVGYQVIYEIWVYKPGFNLSDFYFANLLDVMSLNFIGIASLFLLLRKKQRGMLFLFSVYLLILVPMLIFIPLDRLTVITHFLLIITYSLSPLVFAELFNDGNKLSSGEVFQSTG